MKTWPVVGVFDSGVGGLYVLKELSLIFPKIQWIYIADTLHWPYGEKNKKELELSCRSMKGFLISSGAKGIVIACNTASSLFVNQSHYKNIPLLNIIQPTCKSVESFVKNTHKKRIGILGTQWTIQSNIYKNI